MSVYTQPLGGARHRAFISDFPNPQEAPLVIENLHTLLCIISDIDPIVSIQADASSMAELARFAPLSTELTQEAPVIIEDLHIGDSIVGDVDVACANNTITDPQAEKSANMTAPELDHVRTIDGGEIPFDVPYGIDVDAEGHVCVFDTNNQRVRVFD